MASKDSGKMDLIYDLVKENREDLNDFRREVKEDNQLTQERLSQIESNSAMQNQHLAEHMRRTDLLEQLHVENQQRIERLERPKIVISTLIKWFLTVGSVAGAVVAIAKLLKLF